jgi:hypothetical protein
VDDKPKGKHSDEHDEQEEKLSSDIYTYKKEEIRRIEKRRDNNRNLFEGVDAATMKEIEELIKD